VKIIPAVDIKGGKCVRLTQGKEDQETVYSDNPQAMAEHWDEEGAQLIHVVDLDGAFQGLPKNSDIIKDIIYSSTVDIQVGGGIRSIEAIASALAWISADNAENGLPFKKLWLSLLFSASAVPDNSIKNAATITNKYECFIGLLLWILSYVILFELNSNI